jgi:hypothetical protein
LLNLEALEDRRMLTVTLTVGANRNVGNLAGDQAETSIAVNPTNPNNLFAISNAGRRFSMDGGVTWANSAGAVSFCCDGKASFDKYGNLFVSVLDGGTAADLWISTNGGANLSVLLHGPGSDYPAVATGPDGTGASAVWFMYWSGGATQTVRGAQVTGLGAVGAFSAPQSAVIGQFGDLGVGADGRVTMTATHCLGSQNGPCQVKVATDFNGLAAGGFAAPVTVVTTNVGTFTPIPAEDNRTIHPHPNVAYTSYNRLFLIYTDRPSTASADTDIYMHLSDGGVLFSPRVKLNDDGATGKSQFYPDIAVDPTTNFIAATWYDCRNSATNVAAQIYGTVSVKRGRNWEPNIQIASGLSNANLAGSFEFGDYDTMDYYGGKFWRSWADNASPSTLVPPNTDAPGDQDQATASVTVVFTPSPFDDFLANNGLDHLDAPTFSTEWNPPPAPIPAQKPIVPVTTRGGETSIDMDSPSVAKPASVSPRLGLSTAATSAEAGSPLESGLSLGF